MKLVPSQRPKVKAPVTEEVTVEPKIAETAAPVKTAVFKAICLSQAPNPQWIYAKVDGIEGKTPVVIPRRLTGRLTGKRIEVEAISDSNGTSYRHIQTPIN